MRRRFLRHLRPWWDIHRHRLAPGVADQIDALMASGALTVMAARTYAVTAVGKSGLAVSVRPRGTGQTILLRVARAINCTGPQGDLMTSKEPLLRSLVRDGLIRPDALGIGIDVDAQSRTIDRSGTPNARILAIGPMTRGATWEIVAVPDIRRQVWTLARRLCNAHWVGGEGL